MTQEAQLAAETQCHLIFHPEPRQSHIRSFGAELLRLLYDNDWQQHSAAEKQCKKKPTKETASVPWAITTLSIPGYQWEPV